AAMGRSGPYSSVTRTNLVRPMKVLLWLLMMLPYATKHHFLFLRNLMLRTAYGACEVVVWTNGADVPMTSDYVWTTIDSMQTCPNENGELNAAIEAEIAGLASELGSLGNLRSEPGSLGNLRAAP